MRHIYQMLTELSIGKSQLSAVYNLRIKTRQCQNVVTCKAKEKKYIYIHTHTHNYSNFSILLSLNSLKSTIIE